jgi:hypothetical protein
MQETKSNTAGIDLEGNYNSQTSWSFQYGLRSVTKENYMSILHPAYFH